MKNRYLSFILLIFLSLPAAGLFGFSQEFLIFLKNLNKAQLINLDQVLNESGIQPIVNQSNQSSSEVPAAIPETPKKTIPSVNRQIPVPENQDFSINISLIPDKEFAVIKSVQGDTRYQKDKSKTDTGNYLFHSGKADSKIAFQIVDASGYALKNMFYFIKIQNISASVSSKTTSININKTPSPSAQTNAAIGAAYSSADTTGAAATNSATGSKVDTSDYAISTINGMSQTEAVRTLTKMLDSTSLSDTEKQKLRYKLIDILLDQRALTTAQTQIDQIASAPVKSLYTARILKVKKSNQEAYKNYLSALSGDEATRKSAILETEEMLLSGGKVDKSAVDLLASETKKTKNDVSFFVKSQINIAKLYQYIPDVYTAKDILESIINGDYDASSKAQAQDAYDELSNNFLNYR